MQMMVVYCGPLQGIFFTTSLGVEEWRLILLCTGLPTILAACKFILFGK